MKEKDAAFSNFTYNGKQYIDLTLDELSFLQYRMQDNCLRLKSLLLEELNKRRTEEEKSQIAQSTFYRFLENLMNGMGIDESIAIQVRLIFEIQVCFFVDLLDFLIKQLIINKGRIYRLMSNKRAKVF